MRCRSELSRLPPSPGGSLRGRGVRSLAGVHPGVAQFSPSPARCRARPAAHDDGVPRPGGGPGRPQPGTVGPVAAAGPVMGRARRPPGSSPACRPRRCAAAAPAGGSRPSTPEGIGAASGCVPSPTAASGLEHRAAWVEAERDGTVTRLVSQVGVNPSLDPDTAVLAMLLAA